IEDHREPAGRALRGGQQLDGFFRERAGGLPEALPADDLVAAAAPATARVGVAPALVLVTIDCVGLDAGADMGDGLLSQRAVAGREGLPFALRRVRRLRERDALDAGRDLVGGEQVTDLGLERERERILLERGLVGPI